MFDESTRQQHPEADLLSAFSEGGLAGHERQQIMEHLAGCPRCRQVIFLAQQAAPEIEMVEKPVAIPFWRRRWIPIFASAAAVCVLAGISLVLFQQQGEKAKAPENNIARQNPAPAPPVNAGGAAGAHAVAEDHIGKPAKPAKKDAPVAEKPRATDALKPRSLAPQVSGTASDEPVRQMAHADEYATSRRKSVLLGESSEVTQSQSAKQSATLGAPPQSAKVLAAKPAYAASYQNHLAVPMARAVPSASGGAAGQSAVSALPSGQAAIASVDLGNRRLVLDGGGALFVSLDQGTHWRRIPQQWRGRATALIRLPQMRTETFSAPGSAPGADSASVAQSATSETGRATAPETGVVVLQSSSDSSNNMAWSSRDGGETWVPVSSSK
jgi:hypothetical protein